MGRNTDAQRASGKKTQRARYERNKEFIAWIKSNNPCHDCGKWYHPACMDFHHVEPGKYRVSSVNIPAPRLTEEIEKCVLVCANCHCLRHLNEDTGFRDYKL